jgi:hypothetical protein
MKNLKWEARIFPLLALAACSGAPRQEFESSPISDGGAPGTPSSGSSARGDGGSPVSLVGPDSGGSLPVSSEGGCPYADGTDHDGDGFSFAEGDCNDCDPNSNPGALDTPKDGIDEDCDGIIDNEPTGCDVGATVASNDPFQAALAIDICRKTTETATGKARIWGVTSATFVAPDRTGTCGGASCAANANIALGYGNLTHLGFNQPQQGSHMLALSSGTARDPTDPGYESVSGFDKGYTSGYAEGFPLPAPACPGVTTGTPHDGAGLELTIRVPTNATSFSFNENFFSYEFPDYVCSEFNDGFTAEMTPQPVSISSPNLVFDQFGNPLSVNNAMLQVCVPQTAGGKEFACPLGSSALANTGFDAASDMSGTAHASTGWLTTNVPIDPSLKGKDITLVFTAWDSGDGVLDSTALVDNVTFSTLPGGVTSVTTTPNPPPK